MFHLKHTKPTARPKNCTFIVASEGAQPERQGKAQQQVQVGDQGRARVTGIEEREEELMEGLPKGPHATNTSQLEGKGHVHCSIRFCSFFFL